MEAIRLERDESLAAVREILDMLITQCQNFHDSYKDEKIEWNKSKKCIASSSSNKDNEDIPGKEQIPPNISRPVIRLAKFAVDPSSKAPEEKGITSPHSSSILEESTADSETLSTDSIGLDVLSDTGKLVEGDLEPQTDNPLIDSFDYGALSKEIDLKTDILDDIDDGHLMTIDLCDENKPSTGFSKDQNVETIYILDDDDVDEKSKEKSKAHKVCFKYMEHEKFSFYKLQSRSPDSQPEQYIILTSSVEEETMLATKLFISKSNFDQIEALNVGDWVWLMAQVHFSPSSNDCKSLSSVKIELEGVPPFIAYIPENIDQVEKCLQMRLNFFLSKKRLSHILKCYREISHRFCYRFIRHGEQYFVNCSEVIGLEWIGLMFEYKETVFRRNKYARKYFHLKQQYVADTERKCKAKILEENSIDASLISESNAKLVDSIVELLEEKIKAKLDGRISGIASEINARISNKETEMQKKNPALNNAELEKQKRHYTEVTNNKIKVFMCPQAHKHKCSKTFTFTSQSHVFKILEHLDIPSEVKHRQYKLLEEQFRKNPEFSLFKDCCWEKNSLDSSLLYLFFDAKKYGDIVPEDLCTEIQKFSRPKMIHTLNQYKTLLSEKDSPSSAIPGSTSIMQDENTSPSVPLLQAKINHQVKLSSATAVSKPEASEKSLPVVLSLPVSLQKDKNKCPQKIVISSFHDVIKLSDHMTIPPKARASQLHNLFKMAREYGRTENVCPISFCQLPVKDESVSHFINQHQIESMLFFLFWDAKAYGYDFPMNLLSSIRKTLRVMYEALLTDYLKFMNSRKNVLNESRSITVPKVQVMISDEVTFDIEVLDTNPEVAKSLPSSSSRNVNEGVLLTTKNSGTTEKNTSLSYANKKKKIRQYSKTRGVVTDSELKKIARNYEESQNKEEINQIKRRKIQKVQGSNSRCQEKLLRSFMNNRKELQKSISSKKGKRRIKRLKKNVSKALSELENNCDNDVDDPAEVSTEDDVINFSPEPEIENNLEDDETDPLEETAEDDAMTISPDPLPLSEINKESKKFITGENEPRLVRSQTFTSFDEMLGITGDRTYKRKSEVEDGASDPWKRLKLSDNKSFGSESLKSFNRY